MSGSSTRPPNGSLNGKLEVAFPPAWVPAALRWLGRTVRHAGVALLAYLAYLVMVEVQGAHASGRLHAAWEWGLQQRSEVSLVQALGVAAAAVLALVVVLRWARRPTFLIDFECYRGEPCQLISLDLMKRRLREEGQFREEALQFMFTTLDSACVSGETYMPPGFVEVPARRDLAAAREEAELVLFGTIDDLLRKTGMKPRQIDVLVTNCSLFNPTPSLSAMVINRFKMRSDISSFHLGGMGCSAGILAVDLAQKLLRERGTGGYALVVSTEIVTTSGYEGNERSMLLPNCIFRMGGSAILLTNKWSERWRAKYQLQHLLRIHMGADDVAYRCIFQRADAEGWLGVELSKDLVKVAAKSLAKNLTKLGPMVLPWSEKLTFAANFVARKLFPGKHIALYTPDFKQCFDHFCIHPGGRAVIEGLADHLQLSHKHIAPSTNALYWYGNTSSSSTWYCLGYCESIQGVKRGDTVWQVAFGSGFKCNSAVWRALRPLSKPHRAWMHLEGREDEAINTLVAIGKAKEKARQAKAAAAERGPAHHSSMAASETPGRVLRSGKVVAAGH